MKLDVMRNNLWQLMVLSGYYKSSSIGLQWVNVCRDNCFAMAWEGVHFCCYVSFSNGAFECFLLRFVSVSHSMSSRYEFWKRSWGFSTELMVKQYSAFFMVGNALVMKRYKKIFPVFVHESLHINNSVKMKKSFTKSLLTLTVILKNR